MKLLGIRCLISCKCLGLVVVQSVVSITKSLVEDSVSLAVLIKSVAIIFLPTKL